ncbi:MAG: hypothetical protein FIA96_01710 [Betaproteobacteria bacterium]|nr:hypothetical protein [Betaproteobacteria bacterium]
MMTRRRQSLERKQRGFALLALVALLVMGGLYFFLANLSPEVVEARRSETTATSLAQARDALIGYALQYREQQKATGDPDAMYGYLPLPDFGESVNLNGNLAFQPCTSEGCAKINPSGISGSTVIVGRFPWKTLGTRPLRDGHGECLWYAISATHRAVSSTATTMNWDTLAVPDVVIGSGLATLAAVNPHDRPLAVIFSAGPAFDNGRTASIDAPECGGNYDVTHYVNAALNNAQRSLPVTSETLFGAIRKNSYFRTDINSMLDRMVTCLGAQLAAGTAITPDTSGFAQPTDKAVGRIASNSCYDDTQNPLGYFSHYRDQVFVAACPGPTNCFTVTDTKNTSDAADDSSQACSAVVIFAGQRGSGQLRSTAAARNAPPNYLEGSNLGSFTTTGQLGFAGPTVFSQVSAVQAASQDIVRCVPASGGTSFTSVQSPDLASGGFSQLSGYDAATQTLTLGALDVRSNNGAPGYALYGCSWTPETHLTASGLRAYFRFKIIDRGDGFVFAMIDGDRNSANVCGAARQHLGYSGNNDPDQSSNGMLPSIVGNETPIISHPKIGIEFDNTRSAGAATAGDPLSAGRNDPDYTPPQDNDAHAAIVYWGDEKVIATGDACNNSNQCPHTGNNCNTLGRCPAVLFCSTADHMCYLRPEYDDNVHSFPVPPDSSTRPTPRNPPAVDPFPSPVFSPAPGLASIDRLGSTTASDRDFHVRVELARNYVGAPADAKDRKGTYKLETWIVAESATAANQITAMKNTTRPMSELYPGFVATLSNDGIRYDEPRGACVAGLCAAGQTCAAGTCYTTGPPVIRDLPMGACNAQQKCSGPPLLKRNTCATGNVCPGGQSCGADNFCYDALYSCGSDNVCYGEAFRTMRLGFTNGQGTQDQVINISDFVTTWLP